MQDSILLLSIPKMTIFGKSRVGSLSEQAGLALLFCKQSKLDVLADAKNLSSFHFLLYRTTL